MKSKLFTIGIILFCLRPNAQVSSNIPRLVKTGNYVQLLVDNKPFLILGGELGNSSASSNEYMRPVWPTLKQMNLNTVIAPVYWELIEPVEGRFDFSLADTLLRNARLNKMKLVLLWFAGHGKTACPAMPGMGKTQFDKVSQDTWIKPVVQPGE